MSRCAFALVALLLAGTLPLAARAGEPAPPKPAPPPSPQAADTDPGPEVIIYVPIDEMDVILEADRRGVVLRYEEYRALLEEARARARAQARRPPARAALLSATGEVDLETGRLVATWRVRVLEDGVAFVPFPFHDVALETIEVEGGRYEERNAMGWLRLEGKGERSVRVVGRVGETEDGERHSVAFRLPPAAAMALRVAAPASATGEVAGEGAPIAIETGPSEGEIVDVRPAPDGRVAASWTPAARGPVGPPVLDAEIQVLHVLAGNLARTRAVVRVRISRTPAQSVALSLPAASAVRSVGGKGMIGSRRSDDRGTLTLDFDAPHRGVVQAVLDLETPYEPGPDTALPRIDVVDAVRQRTELALRVERGVVLEDVRIRGGRRLPLPKKAPDVLRYELADASSEVRVDLVPTELVIEASSTWYLNLTEAAKTLLAAVTYRVDEGNAFVLEPHFPEGFRLTDLQIDGQRDGFRHEMREDGVLEVHLARAVPKNATVQLAATLEQAGVDWVPEHGRIAVPFRVPSAGADREEGFVAVGADASFRVLDRDVTDLAPVGAAELTAHGVSPEGLVYGYRRDGDAPHLVLEVERRVPRVDADVIARAIPLPGRLEIVAQVIHRIERSGLRRLAIDIPAWAGDTVRIEGAGVTSSHAVDDAAGVPAGFRRWEVTLSRRLLGAHRLRVRYHEVEDAETWTIPADRPLAPRVPDVRETRSVVVERAAGLEVDLQGDLPIQDLAELPAGAQVNPLAVREVVRLPGDREGPGIAVTKHEGTEVLDAIGTRVEVETAVASAGILRTQARIHLENVGLQFLRVALPRGSTLVGAIVDEQPVKPLVDEAGVLRVPIPPAHRDGARTVARLTYDTHLGEPLGDAVAVPAPRFPGLEVLETTIEVAVDPGLEIEGVKGDFGVARRAPEPPLPWIVHALGALVAEGKDAAGAGPTAGAVGAPSAYTQRPHGEKAPQKGLVPLAEPTLRAKPRGAEETTGSMVEDDEGMPVPDAYAPAPSPAPTTPASPAEVPPSTRVPADPGAPPSAAGGRPVPGVEGPGHGAPPRLPPTGLRKKGLLSLDVPVLLSPNRVRGTKLGGGGVLDVAVADPRAEGVRRGTWTILLLAVGLGVAWGSTRRLWTTVLALVGTAAAAWIAFGAGASLAGSALVDAATALLALRFLAWAARHTILRRPAATALLLAALTLAGAPLARADEEPAEGSGVAPRTVVVPYDPADPAVPRADDRVFLPLDTWLRLRGSNGVPEERGVALLDVRHRLRVQGDEAEVTTTFRVSKRGSGMSRFAIPLGGSGVREARLDGEPVPLLTEGPSPEVVLKKAGDHEIVLVYRVPVDVSREARVVAWQAPAAATGILEADVPGFEGQLRVPGAARVEGEGEHWRVFLGAVAKIEVRLVHAEPREPEVPLRTRAESQIVHRIRHGGVETVDEITLHVLQGDADHVDVALPPGALLLDAGGDGVARWETGQQSVRVVFAQPRQGAVKATVKVFVPAAEPNRETELPALPVLDTTGEGGIVVLDSEPSLRVEAIETTGLFRTATPAKPVAPEDGLLPSDQRVVGAWRFAARPTRFRVRVEELPSRTQANSVIAAVFGQDRVRTFVVLSLDPDARRPVGTFVFALPGTDRVASVRSPGLDNWWTEGEGDGRTLRLRYGDLVAGARTVTLALERRLGGKRDAVMVPRIALRGAVQDAGRLILYALPDVEVAPGALPGLRAVPVELGSVPRPPMADAVARHAFRYEAPLEASLPVSLGSPSPEADAFVVTHVEPSDDVHRLEHLVVFDVRRGLTDRFQLFVPDGGRTDDDLIRAADLREIRETPATRRGPAGEEVAGRLYTVTLQAPRGDLVEITVSQRWRAGTPIRVVRPEGVTTTRWFALVGKFLDGEVRFDTGGAERADWTDLPFVPAGLQPADVVRPVLTARAPYVLDLEARRQAIELSADAVIRAAAAVGVLGRDGEVRVEAVWRLQNRRRQFLRLRLPPHALLYGVTVAGAPVRPLEAPGREILVPVPKVPLGRAGYDVKLLYRAPAGARLPSKDLRFDLPEVLDGVAVDRTIVRLYVPKDFDVQFETDMANASRTDVAADLAEAAVDEANELIEVARTGTYEQRLRAAQQAQVLLQAATVQNRRAEGKRKQVDVDLDRARHAWNEQLSSLRQDRETEARLRANRQVDLYASNSMELLRTAQADETRTQATAGQGGYWTLNGEPPIDKADDGKKDELSKEVSALRARVGQVLLLRQTRANQTAAAPQAQTEAGRAGGAAGGDFDAQAQDQNVQKLNEALRRDQQAKQQLGTTIEAGQRAAVPGDIDVEGTAGYGVSDFVPPTVRLVSPDEVSDQEEPLFGAQVDTGLVLQGLSGAETPGPLVNLDDVTNGVRDGRRGYDHGAAGWTTGAALNGDHGIFYDDSGDGTYAARVENLFDRAMVETATRKGLMGVDVAIPREGRMVQFRATGRGAPITMEARSNEVAPAARWVVFLVLVAGGAGLVFALTRRGARLPKDAGSEPPTSPEATPERNSPAAP